MLGIWRQLDMAFGQLARTFRQLGRLDAKLKNHEAC